jgi:hypothetical protein
MVPISFIDYDKISDDLYHLGNNVLLRFNVQLAKKGEDGKRYHFHKEYAYNSRYLDRNTNLMSIKRSFDYHMSIEKVYGDNRESIMIRVQDIMNLQMKVNDAVKWFMGNGTFAYKKDKLILLGNPEAILITGFPAGKWIKIEPIIINFDGNYTCGARMYISSDSIFVDMDTDKFMGFVYLINKINMYESAQLLLNYLQRPEFGTNVYSFDSHQQSENIIPDIQGKNRTIPSKKSFFQ